MVRYLAIAVAILWPALAGAQTVPGQFPAGTVYGNPGATSVPPRTVGTFTNRWTTGTRPVTPFAGQFGYNSTSAEAEMWDGATWVSMAGGLTATELHIGEVGQNQTVVSQNFATTAVTYVAGNAMGGLVTLTGMVRASGAIGVSGTSGQILSTTLTFQDNVGVGPVDVVYFNSSPTASQCNNNAAFTLNTADRNKVIGIAHVTDFQANPVVTVGQLGGFPMPFSLASATSVFACVVARGSMTVTTAGASTLNVRVLRQ